MSAVNAGQSVTVHERPVAISGWSGTGYMVVDAQTGSSAFIIGGVGNGGYMMTADDGLANIILIGSLAMFGFPAGTFGLLLASIVVMVSSLILTYHSYLLLGIYDCGDMQVAFLGLALLLNLVLRRGADASAAMRVIVNGYYAVLYPKAMEESAKKCNL